MAALSARQLATGLYRPVIATSPPGDTARPFLVEQHTGKVRIFRTATGKLDADPFLTVPGLAQGNTAELFPGGGPSFPCSFSEDAAGELYLLNLTPGEFYQIVPPP